MVITENKLCRAGYVRNFSLINPSIEGPDNIRTATKALLFSDIVPCSTSAMKIDSLTGEVCCRKKIGNSRESITVLSNGSVVC